MIDVDKASASLGLSLTRWDVTVDHDEYGDFRPSKIKTVTYVKINRVSDGFELAAFEDSHLALERFLDGYSQGYFAGSLATRFEVWQAALENSE